MFVGDTIQVVCFYLVYVFLFLKCGQILSLNMHYFKRSFPYIFILKGSIYTLKCDITSAKMFLLD